MATKSIAADKQSDESNVRQEILHDDIQSCDNKRVSVYIDLPVKRWVGLWHRRHIISPELPKCFASMDNIDAIYITKSSDFEIFLQMYQQQASNLRDKQVHRPLFLQTACPERTITTVEIGTNTVLDYRTTCSQYSKNISNTSVKETNVQAYSHSLQHLLKQKQYSLTEELCFTTVKSPCLLSENNEKEVLAYHVKEGFVGRDADVNVAVATESACMDPFHAMISADREGYMLQDNNSSTGTYLCLTTCKMRRLERDGFRLQVNDIIHLGKCAKLQVRDIKLAVRSFANALCDEGAQQSEGQDRSSDNRKSMKAVRFEDSPTIIECISDQRSFWKLDTKGRNSSTVGVSEIHCATSSSRTEEVRYKHSLTYRRAGRKLYPAVCHHSVASRLSISLPAKSPNAKEKLIYLHGKFNYTIGSSPTCDIHVSGDCVEPLHASISFDGYHFILRDLSFQTWAFCTRVALTRPTRLGVGDTIQFGTYTLSVDLARHAYPDTYADVEDIGLRCQLLRTSKRKKRQRGKYFSIVYRHRQSEPLLVGRGMDCNGRMQSNCINSLQFRLYVDSGTSFLVPHCAGLNQGLYFLLGRSNYAHELHSNRESSIQYTSKPYRLDEKTVIRCGCSELEISYVKLEPGSSILARHKYIQENKHLLQGLFWLAQIRKDHNVIMDIAKRAQRLSLEIGDCVYNIGDSASYLFLVVQGEIELQIASSHGVGSGENCAPDNVPHVETILAGGFFGEDSLLHTTAHYVDTAIVKSKATLLMIDSHDLRGTLRPYLDICYDQLRYDQYRDVMILLRKYVPLFQHLTYEAVREIASRVRLITFDKEQWIVRNGHVQIENAKYGLLLLQSGDAELCIGERSDVDISDQKVKLGSDSNILETEIREHGNDQLKRSEIGRIVTENWDCSDCVHILPNKDLPQKLCNIVARSNIVACYFFDLLDFVKFLPVEEGSGHNGLSSSKLSLHSLAKRMHLDRKQSLVQRRQSVGRGQQMKCDSMNDVSPASLDEAVLENDGDTSQRWRRKKRNRTLLEDTIRDIEQSADMTNALVIYVLSGANRGDIHVVGAFADIGGLNSGCSIELNDCHVSKLHAYIQLCEGRYWICDALSDWGTYVRLEEAQRVQVTTGDVLMAGEVEFTCLRSVPSKVRTSACCVQ